MSPGKAVLYTIFWVLYTPGKTKKPRSLKLLMSPVPFLDTPPVQAFPEQMLSCHLTPEALKYPVSQHTLLLLS